MGEVAQLNVVHQLNQFFDAVYGEGRGYVYAPSKNSDGEWSQHFFKWPEQRSELVDSTINSSRDVDCYYSPALFSQQRVSKSAVAGSSVVWVEFDGILPTSEAIGELPQPSIRLQSSNPGHEHWIWRLDQLCDSYQEIEVVNRGLAYKLGADASGWDATQVLRPPGTYNHKSDPPRPVAMLKFQDVKYGYSAFDSLPCVEQIVQPIEITEIPDALAVVAKYPWKKSDFDFFRKPSIEVSKRSSALTRLCYTLIEMGMMDGEVYSILLNADERWKKFWDRRDRAERILSLVNYCRIKKNIKEPSSDDTQIFGFYDFIHTNVKIDWLIEGILERRGCLLLSSRSGAGKSQLSLQFAIHMCLGKKFLGWEMNNPEPPRIVFFSMEMHHAALKHLLEKMAGELSDEEQAVLNERFFLVPLGHGIYLDSLEGQKYAYQILEKLRPDGIMYDSLGKTIRGELSDDAAVKSLMAWDSGIRAEFDLFSWYIHHNRKAQIGNKKPNSLDDVFGSQYVVSEPTTVLGLWPEGSKIEVSGLKVRLSESDWKFEIERTATLNFTKVVEQPATLMERAINEYKKEAEKNENRNPFGI